MCLINRLERYRPTRGPLMRTDWNAPFPSDLLENCVCGHRMRVWRSWQTWRPIWFAHFSVPYIYRMLYALPATLPWALLSLTFAFQRIPVILAFLTALYLSSELQLEMCCSNFGLPGLIIIIICPNVAPLKPMQLYRIL